DDPDGAPPSSSAARSAARASDTAGEWQPAAACRAPARAMTRPIGEPRLLDVADGGALGAELPRGVELLGAPQRLSSCPGVRIVENRDEPEQPSKPLDAAALVWLERVCCASVTEFLTMARAAGRVVPEQPALELGVSFIPD